MWTKSTCRVGQHVLVLRVALLDAERIADLVQLARVAPADGVHVGVGMLLVDRNELGPKAQPDDRDVDLLLGHDRPPAERMKVEG